MNVAKFINVYNHLVRINYTGDIFKKTYSMATNTPTEQVTLEQRKFVKNITFMARYETHMSATFPAKPA